VTTSSGLPIVPACGPEKSAQPPPGLVQLERQVERGNLFAHTALGENALRLGELEVIVHGLTDALLEKGIVSEGEITNAMSKVHSELKQRSELNGARAMVRSDGLDAKLSATVKVDCGARLHICHAVCCKLDFALSIPEVESGTVKWDLGRPYFIRRESDGCCTHLNSASATCRIYGDRPGVCKGYTCAGDARIWKDFDKMVLNQEWIDANLSHTTEPHVAAALMHDRDRLTKPNGSEQNEAGDGKS
jgi:Fe-S-cluster containining protein